MKKILTLITLMCLTAISAMAEVKVTAVTDIDAAVENGTVVNLCIGDKYLYGPSAQNTGMGTAEDVLGSSVAVRGYKIEMGNGGAYLFRCVTPAGGDYALWGATPCYLNSQPAGEGTKVTFNLGKDQDCADGSTWILMDGGLLNGGSGMYFNGTSMSQEPVEVSIVEITGTVVEPEPDAIVIPTSLQSYIDNQTVFTLKSGDNYVYGPSQQNLAVGTWEQASSEENNANGYILENDDYYFYLRAVKTDGSNISAWGTNPCWLNNNGGNVVFNMGRGNINGQDVKNGAAWKLAEISKGKYSIESINQSGKYLAVDGNAGTLSETATEWELYVPGAEPEPKSWTKPAAPKSQAVVTDGETAQYLWNEAGGFLLGANDWNTRASVSPTKGYKIMITDGAEGCYQLIDSVETQKEWKNIFIDNQASIWVDNFNGANKDNWTILPDGEYGFKIGNTAFEGENLGVYADLSNTRLYMTSVFNGQYDEDLYPAAAATYTWYSVSVDEYNNYIGAYARYDAAMTLKKAIDDAEAKYPGINLSSANAVYNNSSATLEQLTAALEDVKAAVKEKAIANAPLAEGEYYIVNQDAEAFLSNGAYWGTRAVFVKDNGIAYNVKINPENGKYTLYSGIKGDTKALRPSDGFNDQSGEWEIIKTDDQNGGVYLYNGEKYFSHVEGSMIPDYVDTPTAGSVWNFVTLDMIKEDLANATRENPRNATVLIKAADFLNQDVANAAWDGYKVGGATGSGNTIINNTNSEKWNAGTYTVSQTVEGLPNGFYNLTAFGFYREGNRDTAGASDAFEAGTENASILKANNKEVALKSIYSEAKTAAEGGWSSESTSTSEKTYYIPNSQADAAACFEAGAYVNELKEIEVTDGKLTISVSREGEAIFDWTVFDNFRLTYLGTEAAAEDEEIDVTTLPWVKNAQDCTQDFGENKGNIYGTDAGGNNLSYVDITGYDAIKVYGAEGSIVRAFINREEANADGKQFIFVFDAIGADGTATFDLSNVVAAQGDLGHIYLNGIKAGPNWNSTATVSRITLIKKGSSTTPKPAATLSDITLTLPEGADFEEDGDLKVVLDYKATLENCNGLLISGNAYYTVKDAEGQVVKTSSVDFDTDATTRNVFISGLKYNKDYVVTIDKMEVINTDLTTFESTALTTVEENLPSLSIKLVKPMATISGIELAQIPADQTLSASDKDFTVVFNYAIATEGCEGGIPAGCVEYTVKDANGNTVLDSSTDLDIDKTTRNIYLKGLNFDETYTMTVYKVSVNFLDFTTFDTSIIEEVTEGLPTVTFTVAPPVKISNEAIAIQNVDLDANTAEASYSFKAAINAEYPDATAKVAYDIIDENGDVVANGTADVDLNTVPTIIKLENIPTNGKFIVKIKNIDIYQNASATDPIYNISSSAVGFCGIYQGYIASTGMLLTNGVSKSLEQNETVAVSAGEITFSNVMIPVVNIATGNFTVPVTTETNAEGQTIYKAQEVDVELHDVYISGGQDDPVPFKAWLVGIESTDGPILFLHLQSNLQDLFIAFNSRLQDAKWMMNSIAPEEVNAGGAKIINFLEATSINSVATDAKADGKYFENGKVVIKNNDKKYNVNGAIIK